jgi:adenine-specific DNA glycosylase
LRELPDVFALANADDDRLHKLWEGLGYYSRARNLKKAADEIVSRFGGAMPRDYAALLTLSGIGEYTAGAIASIAYGEAVPAVDGNVLRVYARLLAVERDIREPALKKEVRAFLLPLVPKEKPGVFNAALMDRTQDSVRALSRRRVGGLSQAGERTARGALAVAGSGGAFDGCRGRSMARRTRTKPRRRTALL